MLKVMSSDGATALYVLNTSHCCNLRLSLFINPVLRLILETAVAYINGTRKPGEAAQ